MSDHPQQGLDHPQQGSDHPPQGSVHPSFSLYQENSKQSSAQGSQPLAPKTSVDTFGDVRKQSLSYISTSSLGYKNPGPLRVINTNEAPSPTKSSSTSDWPDSPTESSFDVDKADTSSIKLPVPNGPNLTDGNSSIAVADTARHSALPFRKWVSTIRRNDQGPKGVLTVRKERWSLDDFDEIECAKPADKRINGHRKSSSWSSYGLVGAVKSATASLMSLSVPPQSRKLRTILTRNGYRSSNRSSWLANPRNSGSMDSSQEYAQAIDDAAWERALQRRRTLEELISSEESYVCDLKVLLNVYLTVIASVSSGSLQKYSQAHYNVREILNLHEEILYQIRRVVSDSEIRSDAEVASRPKSPKHTPSNSLGVPEAMNPSAHSDRHSPEATPFGRPKREVLLSDPREVTEVAKIFGRLMGRFFIYEEYGAKYESTMLEMISTSKTIPNWHIYERSIEALANSLASTCNQAIQSKKCLSFEDLLIKPIQRICKYPLLFADLQKHTPVIDGPDSREELEKVSCNLKEMVKKINKATNDQDTRAKIKRSWQLQELLILPETSLAQVSFRFFGHATLCGVLFVAYQCGSDVRGEYMLCVLFKSHLLLAIPKQGTAKFSIAAIISLKDTQIDKSDNGRGLQCYTAPYSWKLIFESSQQLYELIFCACSGREAEQWKSNLFENSAKEGQTQLEGQAKPLTPVLSLALNIRPLGYIFGHPGTLMRRLSIQRAATVGSRSNVSQVIITNTSALKEYRHKETSASYSISRSKSLPMGNRVLVLAPKRADRMRMECILTDVWTRDLLPYPGMSPNRGEHLIRTSASSMIRRLSRASKSSSLKKRSGSHTALDFDRIPPYHINGESSVTEGTHGRPTTNFPYGRHLSRTHDESAKSPSCVGSPPGTNSGQGFGGWKEQASKSRQCPETNMKTEGNGTLDLRLSKKASRKRSNPKMLLKAFSSDTIRSWLT